MRNLGSVEASLKGSSIRESKFSSSGGGDGVSSRGGSSNKDWMSPTISVIKEVDAVISSVISKTGSGADSGVGSGIGWKMLFSMSSQYLLFWSRYFHFLVGKWYAIGQPL